MSFHDTKKQNRRMNNMCMTAQNNELNLNDVSYNDIEVEVEKFLNNPTPLTIVTGSSSHMIEKVENVVQLHNPYYNVLDNGIKVWKEVA